MGTLQFVTTPTTLSAATGAQIAASRYNRKRLVIQNTGTGAVTFGFGTAAPVAGAGITLDPASAANGQGGSYEFGTDVPTDAIWAISTAGSTVAVVEGFGSP